MPVPFSPRPFFSPDDNQCLSLFFHVPFLPMPVPFLPFLFFRLIHQPLIISPLGRQASGEESSRRDIGEA